MFLSEKSIFNTIVTYVFQIKHCECKFKINFQNRTLNYYPIRKKNYFSHFQASAKNFLFNVMLNKEHKINFENWK